MPRSRLLIIALAAALIATCTLAPANRAATTNPSTYHGVESTNRYTPLPSTRPDGTLVDFPSVHVEPISDQRRREFRINPFYTKSLIIDGIPVIGSDKVSDFAFLECAYTLDHMLADSPPQVREALLRCRVRVGIIAVVEYTMDIPENQTPQKLQPMAAAFQDRRSRGLGGLPLATCAEENLLNLRGDPYTAENITIHEFSHTVASSLGRVDPDWYEKLRDTYQQAMAQGLFAHSYSATNEQEYWAEGAQAWFDCASQREDPTVHSGIWNRSQLKSYDPSLAALLAEVYGDGAWRYVKTTNRPVKVDGFTFTRSATELSHLAGLDRSLFPVFNFSNSPRIAAVNRAERTSP